MPPTVVTLTLPLAAPASTVAVIWVAIGTPVIPATTPPIFTSLPALIKLVPVIVITVPAAPEVGVKEVIVGAGAKVNPVLVAVPPAVVTETVPLAPVPIVAEICVPVLETIVAAVPPNVTAVAPVRFVPVIVTVLPCPVVAGVNDVIVGTGTKVKLADELTFPPVFATLITPVAPWPATAVIEVADVAV